MVRRTYASAFLSLLADVALRPCGQVAFGKRSGNLKFVACPRNQTNQGFACVHAPLVREFRRLRSAAASDRLRRIRSPCLRKRASPTPKARHGHLPATFVAQVSARAFVRFLEQERGRHAIVHVGYRRKGLDRRKMRYSLVNLSIIHNQILEIQKCH